MLQQQVFYTPLPGFSLEMLDYQGGTPEIDRFVQDNSNDVHVFVGSARLSDVGLYNIRQQQKFLVGIVDELFHISVREMHTEQDIRRCNFSQNFSLDSATYLLISETKRNDFIEALDSMGNRVRR